MKSLPVVVVVGPGFPVCGRRTCVSVWDNGTRDSNGDGDDASSTDDGSFRRRHLQFCLESRVSRGELLLHVTPRALSCNSYYSSNCGNCLPLMLLCTYSCAHTSDKRELHNHLRTICLPSPQRS